MSTASEVDRTVPSPCGNVPFKAGSASRGPSRATSGIGYIVRVVHPTQTRSGGVSARISEVPTFNSAADGLCLTMSAAEH